MSFAYNSVIMLINIISDTIICNYILNCNNFNEQFWYTNIIFYCNGKSLFSNSSFYVYMSLEVQLSSSHYRNIVNYNYFLETSSSSLIEYLVVSTEILNVHRLGYIVPTVLIDGQISAPRCKLISQQTEYINK